MASQSKATQSTYQELSSAKESQGRIRGRPRKKVVVIGADAELQTLKVSLIEVKYSTGLEMECSGQLSTCPKIFFMVIRSKTTKYA